MLENLRGLSNFASHSPPLPSEPSNNMVTVVPGPKGKTRITPFGVGVADSMSKHGRAALMPSGILRT